MLDALPKRKRNRAGMTASFAAHLLLLFALLYQPTPVSVTPSDVELGVPHSSGSQSIVYLAPVGPERSQPEAQEHPKLALNRAATKPRELPKPQPKRKPPAATAADAPEQTARGGSPFGGRIPGSPLTGNEVIPAFPDVYPDPPVTRDDIPNGVQGDVIVEVTIDSRGNVVETKLLRGIGFGVEQKVLAVLQRWHFHPAMRDGQTIASQHIVHFHYPG